MNQSALIGVCAFIKVEKVMCMHVPIQRGDRESGPPGKSQVIWVSIEISIWTPVKKVGPLHWKMLYPLWVLRKV